MMVSITKLASSENLEQEIRRLEQEHPHLRTSVDFLNSRLDSTNSADFIEKYGRLIQTWLITAAHVVIPEIVKHKEVK
uniref:Uncharacterized protein n=1 Tax=Mesocestoides corti TaxID=53468 RepID=A0A5K3G475_MESCO